MDDSQTAFATQYPPYVFDIDMMKVPTFQISHCIVISPFSVFFPYSSALWIPLAVPMQRKQDGPRIHLSQPAAHPVLLPLVTFSRTTVMGLNLNLPSMVLRHLMALAAALFTLLLP